MKEIIKILIPAMIALIFGIAFAQSEVPTGEEIVEKMTDIMSQETSKSTLQQIIVTSSGHERTFEFEMFTAEKGEKTLMRYLKPSAAKGQTFLMLNNANDIWTYFPRTNRVRKLASSSKNQKVQGSDFSYEDFGSGDSWKKEYKSKNIGSEKVNGNDCWKLESIGIPEEKPSYSKMVVLARKSDSYPLLIHYYNDEGYIEKSLEMDDIRVVEGVPTAFLMKMVNHEEGSETIMKTLSTTYEWMPPSNFFSERTLKK